MATSANTFTSTKPLYKEVYGSGSQNDSEKKNSYTFRKLREALRKNKSNTRSN